ncbi:UPF0716 protein FxsA [Colwellia chukchiensis]|uniref:UPF0716 protein FxsA n=1 Tax=Colwellia chukchiensis TaxID=641665 RepID=A0A1H7N5P6_9GAMM|nr:FxsA family protein [Colwellia chukchiensis]SEL18734.1 UPF0716 protein FxsA [Colwellia chukchiensis]
MFRLLFVFFIIIPIIEISVLLQVGSVLGLWPTIAIVIFTAWLGAKYVRQQGLATLNSVQSKMAQGQMPSDEIVTGLMLLVAGVLLVTPGFVTDIFGLSLLVPAVRSTIVSSVKPHMASNASATSFHFQQHNDFSSPPPESYQDNIQPPHKGTTLDGEYERKD